MAGVVVCIHSLVLNSANLLKHGESGVEGWKAGGRGDGSEPMSSGKLMLVVSKHHKKGGLYRMPPEFVPVAWIRVVFDSSS